MLTNDELHTLYENAKVRVEGIAVRSFEAMHEPEIQRSELAQYLGMSPGDHARLYAQVGEEKYREYAVAMEWLRRSQGG